MDAVQPKRRTRYSTAPRRTRSGKLRALTPATISPVQFSFLKSLARYRFLSIDYLAALNDTSYEYGRVVVDDLKAKPNCFIKIADEQSENPNLYLRLSRFFELSGSGITELVERGIFVAPRKPAKNLRHQVMVDQIMASFEIGTAGAVVLISRSDILAKAPEKTRQLAVPDRIPLPKDRFIRPDGEMFALKTAQGFSFFPGIEADTGTEPIHSYDYDRSSISGKFADYITVIEREIYKTHFGARTFLVPFLTPTTRRLESMTTMLAEMTKSKPSLRQHFLFKTHPLFTSSTKPRATGHMIDGPWARVGYPPLDLKGK